jgi:hypothetical protein
MGTIGARRRMAFAVLAVFGLCVSGTAAAIELPAVDAALPDPLGSPGSTEGALAPLAEPVERLTAPLAPQVETRPAATDPDAGATDQPVGDVAAPTMAALPSSPGPARSPAPENREEAPPSSLAQAAAGTAAPARDTGAPNPQQGGQRRPAVAQAAADFSLPLGIAALVIAFLLVQARLDRHDPKLLAASAHRGDALPFS